ncbi:MAG TPA: LCP family protein [Chloroflexia bacterium]|jgi:LCP family protein required for cell wall assembly|nr:LCP family protein [Chloroflexia bacterium]
MADDKTKPMAMARGAVPPHLTPGKPAGSTGRPRRRRPLWLRLVLGVFVVALVAVLGYAGTVGYTLWGVSNHIYKPLPTLAPETGTAAPQPAAAPNTPRPGEPTWTPDLAATEEPVEPLPPGRINILVLGTDKRAELGSEAARSDTLILLSVDPKWKTAGILSIPRDLQVTVPGYGLQKINAAYFFGEYNKIPGGGPALAVPTVSKFFNVPIDYYVSVNFAGFQKIVDEVGGIDVYVPETIDDPEYPGPYNSYIHVHFDAGCTHMDGEEALEYARTRHADSDFGRARRQQQVIRAVRDKALELNMLPRYPELLNQLGDSVETNIPPDKQLAFAQLASQIKASDIYMAQIDAGMVREVSDTGDLILNRAKAKPMLDWFFGRGKYASLRPGAVLTPTPTPTVKATATPAKRATATPTRSLDGVPVEPTETLEPTGPIADGLQPPPMGQCR